MLSLSNHDKQLRMCANPCVNSHVVCLVHTDPCLMNDLLFGYGNDNHFILYIMTTL